ncbi:MAG: hypothetical protein QF442_00400 [Candidatus Peribacteraceae bacterium]|jgi:hypothetical protein|nr:hypothetical protein [Candidatus Peribacteraceae bacterium]
MQKQCAQCSAEFEVTDEDLAFYDTVSPEFSGKKYDIPPPTQCPECRQQRRMIWRNERVLYRRNCDKTGKPIVSCFSKDCPYTVYSQGAFWSDDWDPRDSGRDIDFSRPFFEQFNELLHDVPHIALLNMQTENSEFCHRIYDGRNNYMSIIALYAPENLIHTYYTMACKDCTDTAFNQYCELCYEVVDTEKCYNCHYGLRLNNCSDCYFSEDCTGCKNCFGCKNLHQQSYCIFNEQKSPEEYKEFMDSCKLDSHNFVKENIKKSKEFFEKLPHRSSVLIDTTNVTGGSVYHCQESKELYDWYESERMTHCALGEKSHDCMDVYGMGVGDFCLESVTNMYVHHLLFCSSSANSSDLLYCHESSSDTTDCFGCASMKKGKYCILNKQYTKDEYEDLSGKLIEHMRSTGEWGEFFPIQYSPTAYNESVAQDYYPLTKDQARKKGYRWQEADDTIEGVTKTIPSEKLPDSLSDIPDDIVNWAISCSTTKRPFKIVKQELDFYRSMNIPIPHLHPEERHRLRITQRNPRKLWDSTCPVCQKTIQTTYSPDRPETVYCEECYLKEVY